MCESKVVTIRNGEEVVLMEDVIRIEVEGDKLKLFGLLGESSEIKGRISVMDMKTHKILVEE
ncbi:RNA-binding protein [Archaeoglobales archaeon]|nr:MAG: RNA-binding protein [Archaeoglobales archaeon]